MALAGREAVWPAHTLPAERAGAKHHTVDAARGGFLLVTTAICIHGGQHGRRLAGRMGQATPAGRVARLGRTGCLGRGGLVAAGDNDARTTVPARIDAR